MSEELVVPKDANWTCDNCLMPLVIMYRTEGDHRMHSSDAECIEYLGLAVRRVEQMLQDASQALVHPRTNAEVVARVSRLREAAAGADADVHGIVEEVHGPSVVTMTCVRCLHAVKTDTPKDLGACPECGSTGWTR